MVDYDPDDLLSTTDIVEAQVWLEDVEVAIDECAFEPSAWEVEFLESLRERVDRFVERPWGGLDQPFTGKQLVKLRQLYDRL